MVEWKECERLGLGVERGKTVKIMTVVLIIECSTSSTSSQLSTRQLIIQAFLTAEPTLYGGILTFQVALVTTTDPHV